MQYLYYGGDYYVIITIFDDEKLKAELKTSIPVTKSRNITSPMYYDIKGNRYSMVNLFISCNSVNVLLLCEFL